MKFFIFLMVFSQLAVAAPKNNKRTLPISKAEEQVKKDKVANEKLKALNIEEEDCDDKAKKPVEIVPETISLSGTAGCTLPE